MICECLWGMLPFLLILIFTINMYAIMLMAVIKVNKDNKNHKWHNNEYDYYSLFGHVYMILFGNNPDNNTWFEWFIFITFSVSSNIVLMNLLISIISDDYDRIQLSARSTDLKAKCQMLLEVGELIRFFF